MRITLALGLLCICTFSVAADLAHASVRKELNLPSEPLGSALQDLAKVYAFQLLYHTEIVAGVKSQGASGSLTSDEALGKVLSGTGLSYKYLDANTVMVYSQTSASIPPAAPAAEQSQSTQDSGGGKRSSQEFRVAQVDQANTGPQVGGEQKKRKESELTEIVVTGTHIRGIVPESSPLTVYTREDINATGAATLDQFVKTIPQNFTGIDAGNSFTAVGAPGLDQGGSNQYGGAGINLHGLGPGSTLVLLNGNRLTPGGIEGNFVDISMIPLSAVDRVEVITDGASAVYGTDAIAGVVNFVLRKDFEGAETSARYGASTRGGQQETTISQLLGHSWADGNAMLVYEYDRQGGLLSSERDFIPPQPFPFSLYPELKRNSVILVGSQLIGVTRLTADALYSDRSFSGNSSLGGVVIESVGSVIDRGFTLGMETPIVNDWVFDATGSYLKSNSDNAQAYAGAPELDYTYQTSEDLFESDFRANGSVLKIPGGEVKTATGVGFRTEKINVGVFNSLGIGELRREVSSAYAEIFVPVIGQENELRWARRLELSVAGRWDHYSDAGSSADPKVGLLWSVAKGVDFRATYASSYRVPLLAQQISAPGYEALLLADPRSSTGYTDTLVNFPAGNPSLRPETAHSFTAGITLTPEALPGAQLDLSYFYTRFSNRIAQPPLVSIFTLLSEPALVPFINRNPSRAAIQQAFDSGEVEYDQTSLGAAGIQATADLGLANLALTEEDGIDFSAGYRLDTFAGQLATTISGSYLIKNDYQVARGVPSFPLLNQLGQPTDLKLRSTTSWSKAAFSANAAVNFVNKYKNPLFTPETGIASWTTVDFQLAYKTAPSGPTSRFTRGLTLALNIMNAFDRNPPGISVPATIPVNPGYDSSNANPFGRLISLQLTKQW